VERYLGVLPRLGVPVHWRFQWLPERPRVAAEILEKWRPEEARWVALVPGARWENKRWPLEHFQELARQLPALAPDLRIAILGGKADEGLGRAIAGVAPERCLDLTGRTTLPEMIECLRLCSLVITNDTGPMHVAAALHRPIIALFGPTDPGNTGPYGQRENVIQLSDLDCLACDDDRCAGGQPGACLRNITPAMVLERARRVLTRPGGS
jgi:lipopolysaccharide heptosyltransferase II